MVINFDNGAPFIELTGGLAGLLTNSRLVVSLKRLKYVLQGERILIPFEEKTKIKTLQELQALLQKFSYEQVLAENAQVEIKGYAHEQKTFNEFSEKAKHIRNNSFEGRPELLEGFNAFQKVVKDRLVRQLYPLQLLSAFHMAFSQNACNFAVPGSGKTSIVYGAYAYLKSLPDYDLKHVDKILVIGPLSSFAPWEKEYLACFGKKVTSQRLSGDSTILRVHKEQHLYAGNPAEVTLISHGGVNILQNEIVAFLKNHKTMVVVDEAHRIKNPDGVWGRSVIEIAKEAKARIVLTGTPVPNGYEDLYNLFQYLYPYKFKEIIQLHLTNLQDMTKNCDADDDRVRQFTNNISPYFIRIKKADLGLPLAKEETVMVKMDADQRDIYDFIEAGYVKSFQQDGSAGLKDFLNRARLIRLRQAGTNPSLLLKPIAEAFDDEDDLSMRSFNQHLPDEFQDDSFVVEKIRSYSKNIIPKKFAEIKSIFESKVLPQNGKVIIWSIFIQNAKQLSSYLAANGIESRLLIGEIVQSEREAVIDSFNDPENKDFRVVIANPFAVSESISLHKGCHNAIYMERDYNCATFLQSKDRIHRYGLPEGHTTQYYYLVSSDSIDEVIDQKLDEKVKRMEKIIDEDIPLFSRINDLDETDLIKALLIDYAKRA